MNWHSIRNPLTEADIDNLEHEFQIKLPGDYKSQIGPINGGALRDAYLTIPKLGNVPYSRNVSLSKKAQFGIYQMLPSFNEGTIRFFPFGSVGNGDYFCFDLMKDTVVLYLHETETMFPICKTITELLDMLHVE